MSGDDAAPSLDTVRSDAIRWVIEAAIADGNDVTALADWTLARVAHMRSGLTPGLRRRIAESYPDLEFFAEPGTPHMAAHEGYIENGFSVSFPQQT
ncbi:MAG: hypothetical protein ABIH17_11195 [Pseudomonadota bacterium]